MPESSTRIESGTRSSSETGGTAFHFEIEDIVQQDDRLAARVALQGIQRGEFAGIPATGKRMNVDDFATYRIVGDKITRPLMHSG